MKYNGKKILSLLLGLSLLFGLISCEKSDSSATRRIAVIVKSTDSEFWETVKSGVDAAAIEYQVSVTFEGPESEDDYEAQNELIANAIASGVDAIVLSAIDADRSASLVSEAVRHGIQVIAIDSNVNSSNVSLFIGTDDVEAGRRAGAAAVAGFAEGEPILIGVLNYNKATDNGQKREAGFTEYISAIPNAQIVSVANVNSSVESATAGALTMLYQHPEINVLVGFNEWMTLGIGNAIRQNGLADRVRGIGFDTNVNSIGMIETGEMDALIVQNPFAIGYLGIQNAVGLISGEHGAVENIYTTVTTVTRDNLFDEDIQKILFRFY